MQPFIGEIRTFALGFIPRDWAACEGQKISIQQYGPLFSLIGERYGPSTSREFVLPDLRSRVMIGTGTSTAEPKQNYAIGSTGGVSGVILSASQIPADHMHTVSVFFGNADKILAAGDSLASKPQQQVLTDENINAFISPPQPADASIVPLAPGTIGAVGGGAHENRMPHVTMLACIALRGIFPSRP